MENSSDCFAHAFCTCVCVHEGVYACVHVCDLRATGHLEAGHLLWKLQELLYKRVAHLTYFCVFCLDPVLCLPSPIRHVNGSYHLPFHQPKKKKPCLASLISACHLMRSLLFIFLFVRREGEKHINKAQANPTTLLDGKGLPHLWQKGCLTGI